jgi:hypothetical protein
MALNVVNEAGVQVRPVAATDPTAAGASWSFSKMLADPNFQLLLANMGKAADPEGAGGVIGGAAANMISSKAAQGALEKQDAARKAQIKQLIDLHGGITAPDKPGLNSMKMTPAGALNFELNLGTGDFPGDTGTAAAPVRTQPLVPTQAPAAAVSPTAMRTASARQPGLDEIFPFY